MAVFNLLTQLDVRGRPDESKEAGQCRALRRCNVSGGSLLLPSPAGELLPQQGDRRRQDDEGEEASDDGGALRDRNWMEAVAKDIPPLVDHYNPRSCRP